MTKKLKIYQILTFALGLAFVGLCLFVGITAVQKSMKLNMSFKANPNFYINVEIKAVDAEDTAYNSIFDNQAGVIASGVKLSGATLSLDESFAENYQTDLGVAFSLRITNYMEDVGLLITTEGEGAAALPTEVIVKSASSDANTGELDVYGSDTTLSTLKLTFEQGVFYSVTSNAVTGVTFSGESAALKGDNYVAEFECTKEGYEVGDAVISVNGVVLSSENYSLQEGVLTINKNSVTGNIEITPVLTPIVYTITYNLDGGTNDERNPATYTVETETFKLKIPSKSGYGFAGWTDSGTDPVRNIEITKGTTGNLSYTANWGAGHVLKKGSEIKSLIAYPYSLTFDSYYKYSSQFAWGNGTDASAAGDMSIQMFSNGDDCYILSQGMILANEDCSYMFNGCYNGLTFNNFYTDYVTDMSKMFGTGYEDSVLATTLDLSSFNTSNVTNMNAMFCYCSNLTSVNLSNFDTSNVTDMGGMFSWCFKISLDKCNFDTANVTNMSAMFYYCRSLTSLDVSNFDTSNVTNMSGMFQEISSIELDLSNFDTSKVTDIQYMFGSCNELATIYVSAKWSTASVASSNSMFSYCTSLVGGAGTACDGTNNIDATYARIDDPTNGKPGYFTYKAATA